MIALGVSGGVDSSVCAALLSSEGRPVRGVFMNNWHAQAGEPCRADQDRQDALRVCAALGIPFSVRDFADEYKQNVFAEFLEKYRQGATPNPDILCNREVKFKVFLNDCLEGGADQIATGHYARTAVVNGQTCLLRGVDKTKDQSYFLHAVPASALARTVFSLGGLEKTEVRKIANDYNLVTARKKDSTGICFIGEQDFKSFLGSYLPAQAGDIVDTDGRTLGRHHGALFYTVGQRAPLGGVKGASDLPWFVVEKDVAFNRLIVVQGRDHSLLNKTTFSVTDLSWVNSAPSRNFEGEVQIRHLGEAISCRVTVSDDNVSVETSRPHFGVARGQYAVFYQGDLCLGGGVIA